MIKKAILLFLFLGIGASAVASHKIRVRLYSDKVLNSCQVSTQKGDFWLVALNKDRQVIDTILDIYPEQATRLLQFSNFQNKISVSLSGEKLGVYNGLQLVSKDTLAQWIVNVKGLERIYTGGLEFWPFGSQIHLINEVHIEEYVAGVVESEGGHNTEPEYFAAQAVLARTWVMKNLNKHIEEGYNVKDDQSSQAYYSMAYLQNKDAILKAVKKTRDSVLVDEKYDLILSAFHSNSGGQTANSEDAWSRSVPYLKSKTDSFSMAGERVYWTVNLPKNKVHEFVARFFGASEADPIFQKTIADFKQNSRKSAFVYNGREMPLKHWRTQFGLRSSFFSIEAIENEYILHGRGFGHGVGLSQEGAMEMARRGFTYKEILEFYYQGVVLVNKSQVN